MDNKPFYNSTTLRGALLALFPICTFVLKALNVPINESEMTEVLNAVVGIAAVVMVVWGRFKATAKLTK